MRLMRLALTMTTAAAALMTITIGAAPAEAADRAEIMEKLTGTWNVDEGYNQGQKVSEDDLEGTTTVITATTITTYDRDKKETYRATYTINTTTDPMQIDMVAKSQGSEMKALGIIKFQWLDLDGDDEWTLAYSLNSGERPEKFESPEGSKIMVFEMEKVDD